MSESTRCTKCGKRLGSLELHNDYACERQQEINRENRQAEGAHQSVAGSECCIWCGSQFGHRDGCPMKRR